MLGAPVSVTGPVPVFVTETAVAAVGPAPMLWEPNATELGAALNARNVPSPLSATVALSLPTVTTTESDGADPGVDGSNWTRTLQLSPSNSPICMEQSLSSPVSSWKFPVDGGVTDTMSALPVWFVTSEVCAAEGPSVTSWVNVSAPGVAPTAACAGDATPRKASANNSNGNRIQPHYAPPV